MASNVAPARARLREQVNSIEAELRYGRYMCLTTCACISPISLSVIFLAMRELYVRGGIAQTGACYDWWND